MGQVAVSGCSVDVPGAGDAESLEGVGGAAAGQGVDVGEAAGVGGRAAVAVAGDGVEDGGDGGPMAGEAECVAAGAAR